MLATTLRRGSAPRGVLISRTRASTTRGSAYLACWQGITRPSPWVLSWVESSSQSRPGSSEATRSTETMAEAGRTSVSCGAAGAGALGVESAATGSRSRVGRTPAGSETTAPATATAATATTAPTAVWVRRRVAPARRMIEARGQRASSVVSKRLRRTVGTTVVGTSRCTANWEVAVCSSRVVVSTVWETSRAIWSRLTVARCVSSSTRRWL